jgi:hypothetical protein
VNPLDRQIAESESKLALLLREVKGTPVFERAKLYISKFSNGRPLSEWIHDDKVPVKERATVARTLVEILLTSQHDRLPTLADVEPGAVEAPKEQAAPAAPTPVATPAPAPDQTEDELADLSPAQQELVRRIARSEARKELATLFDRIAKVLRE